MKKYLVLLIVFFTAFIISCKDSILTDEDLAFKGIMETNEKGELIGEVDNEDWLEQWNYPEKDSNGNMIPLTYSVKPAYPNPTKRFTTLRYSVPFDDSVHIELDDRVMNKKTVLLSKKINAGYYSLYMDLKYSDHLFSMWFDYDWVVPWSFSSANRGWYKIVLYGCNLLRIFIKCLKMMRTQ